MLRQWRAVWRQAVAQVWQLRMHSSSSRGLGLGMAGPPLIERCVAGPHDGDGAGRGAELLVKVGSFFGRWHETAPTTLRTTVAATLARACGVSGCPPLIAGGMEESMRNLGCVAAAALAAISLCGVSNAAVRAIDFFPEGEQIDNIIMFRFLGPSGVTIEQTRLVAEFTTANGF